jgi:hypothetical protein
MKYIVISTFKSFNNFKKQIKLFNKQKYKPINWYIFNDSNSSLEIKTDFPITIINGKKNNFWYYKRLAKNLNYLVKKIDKNEWEKAQCILKLDDDTIITKDYIEKLKPFIEDSNFGCVSGRIISKDKLKYITETRVNHYAIGTGMLIRKEILDYLKGYPVIAGSDTVINLTSCYLKYQNQQLNNIVIKQTRKTCSESGTSRSIATAVKQYYLRYPTIILLLNLRRSNKKEFWKNYKAYKKLIKNVKESERLNKKELIVYNKIRLLMVIARNLKKKVI